MTSSIKIWHSTHCPDLEFVHVRSLASPVPKQVSSAYKLVYFERGKKRFWYRGEYSTASSGDLLVIPPGESHHADATLDPDCTLRILHLPERIWDTLLPENSLHTHWTNGFGSPFVASAEAVRCFLRLHRSAKEFVPAVEEQTCLANLLSAVVLARSSQGDRFSASLPSARAIRVLKEYIAQHYAEEISLTQLAELASLHPAYLCRAFTQSVGMPPHAYQIAIRIDHARALLRQGVSVGMAAQETGFYDQAHFVRHFRRFVHLPPSQYARQVKNVQDIPQLPPL